MVASWLRRMISNAFFSWLVSCFQMKSVAQSWNYYDTLLLPCLRQYVLCNKNILKLASLGNCFTQKLVPVGKMLVSKSKIKTIKFCPSYQRQRSTAKETIGFRKEIYVVSSKHLYNQASFSWWAIIIFNCSRAIIVFNPYCRFYIQFHWCFCNDKNVFPNVSILFYRISFVLTCNELLSKSPSWCTYIYLFSCQICEWATFNFQSLHGVIYDTSSFFEREKIRERLEPKNIVIINIPFTSFGSTTSISSITTSLFLLIHISGINLQVENDLRKANLTAILPNPQTDVLQFFLRWKLSSISTAKSLLTRWSNPLTDPSVIIPSSAEKQSWSAGPHVGCLPILTHSRTLSILSMWRFWLSTTSNHCTNPISYFRLDSQSEPCIVVWVLRFLPSLCFKLTHINASLRVNDLYIFPVWLCWFLHNISPNRYCAKLPCVKPAAAVCCNNTKYKPLISLFTWNLDGFNASQQGQNYVGGY